MTGGRFYKLPAEIAARRDIPAAAKLMYAVIANRVGYNTNDWPGIRKLAAEAGISKSTGEKAIRSLANVGLIIVRPSRPGCSQSYQLPKETGHEVSRKKGQECPQNEDTCCPQKQDRRVLKMRTPSYKTLKEEDKRTLKDKPGGPQPHFERQRPERRGGEPMRVGDILNGALSGFPQALQER